MDVALVQALVAEAVARALVATAAIRYNVGALSGSVEIHKHHVRLERLVPIPVQRATQDSHTKKGALLEIAEQVEVDEISAEKLEHAMSQEESEWMRRPQSDMFSVLGLLTKGEGRRGRQPGDADEVILPKKIKNVVSQARTLLCGGARSWS